MDALWIVVVAAVVAAGAYWWFRRRSAPPPVEDEWQLPPEEGTERPPIPLGPQILDREAVLGRNRAFDPTKWDNSPDGAPAGEPEPGDLPRFFDREYLEQKKRGDDPAASG